MTNRRAFTTLVLAIMVAFVAYQPGAGASTRPNRRLLPVLWVWPSGAPCNTTLQACITNAASGDTVLVAQNGHIAESVSITNKSLTLSAQTGFQPTLDAATIQNSSGGATVDVTVSDIGFLHSVVASISQGAGNVLTLDHISAVSSGADPGVYAVVYNESTVNVLHSTFTASGFYPGIEVTSPVSGPSDLTFNVVGNTVTGHGQADYPTGIYLNATDGGRLEFNVDNNSVWDVGQGTASDSSGGIYLSARDSGDAHFNVVGNSLHAITTDGIRVSDEQDAPNELSLDLFDNVIAGTTGSAVDVTADEPATFALRGGRNDLVSNGHRPHTLGHSLGTNLSVAPKFVSPSTGDLALKSSSPLIDEGVTCSPGGVASPDAAGNNRRSRSNVDIGAYEFGAGMPGLVLLGTSGADTLTGGGGNDILCGYRGDDTLHGRGRNDFLDGGKDDDRHFGGPGDDVLCANDGSGGDHLNGGTGTDVFRADPGDVTTSVERLGTCET
jgi:hypothetical protein